MSWVQVVLDFLRQFWPFQIVYSWQKGIRFWCGKQGRALEPGVYMFLPFFSHIETVNVRPDILQTRNQTLTTKDGVSVLVSTNVAYEIFDAVASFVNVQKMLDNLGDECRSQLAGRIRDYTFDELLESQDDIEESCLASIGEVAAEWGVTIIRVSLADFTKTFSLANSAV